MTLVTNHGSLAVAKCASLRRAWVRVTMACPILLALGLVTQRSLVLMVGLSCVILSLVYHVAWQRLSSTVEKAESNPEALAGCNVELAQGQFWVLIIASVFCALSGGWYAISDSLPVSLRAGLCVAFFGFAGYFGLTALRSSRAGA